MPVLRNVPLVPASVPQTATFLEAARALVEHNVAAVAVLDASGRVAGLFTDDNLLEGLFPGYLPELRHTAFLEEDAAALAARLERAGSDPVGKHMGPPVAVDVEASAAHVAERFLHCEAAALPVVEDGRFLGMLGQVAFCRAVLERLTGDPPPRRTGASEASPE